MQDFMFQNDLHDDFIDPFNYEEYNNFCSPFNCTGYSDSNSYTNFDEDDYDERLRVLEDVDNVDIEALQLLQGDHDQTSGAMLNLPLDIFLDVLSRLPIGSLARCRSVCKTWRKIVHHPRFTAMHHARAVREEDDSFTSLVVHIMFSSDLRILEHRRENPDNVMIAKPRFHPSSFKFEVVGSCNGLLCLSDGLYYDPVYVCNPVIGEYVILPGICKRTNYDIVSGFGYDEVGGEYKVIRMMFDSMDYVSEGMSSFKLEAEVYTLGSGVWRKLGDVPYPLHRNSSVFVGGALHWMTEDFIGLDISEHIISFDLTKEEFHVIPPPPGFDFGSQTYKCLGDLKKCLCLFDNTSNDFFDIWVMKDYGVKNSWVKEYAISRQQVGFDKLCLNPLRIFGSGEILMVYNSESLISFDHKRGTFRKLGNFDLPSSFEAITHVGSFVSLKDIIGPTTSRSSVNRRRWYRTMYPHPSHDSDMDMEDWILDYEVEQLAAFLDSGLASDINLDW